MSANNNPPQPVDVTGVPERIKVVIRAATRDGWIGIAYQKGYTGDPSQIHEYVRADQPATIPSDLRRVFCQFHLRSSGRIHAFNECMVEPCPSARKLLTAPSADDYEEVLSDHRRLVRELDVLLNGKNAAEQASLVDIVAQLRARTTPPDITERARRATGRVRNRFYNDCTLTEEEWQTVAEIIAAEFERGEK